MKDVFFKVVVAFGLAFSGLSAVAQVDTARARLLPSREPGQPVRKGPADPEAKKPAMKFREPELKPQAPEKVERFMGGVNGGGGKGIVCRDGAGQIQSVELLDLWEARMMYQRKISKPATSTAEQIDAAIKRLRTVFYSLKYESSDGPTQPGYVRIERGLRSYADLFPDKVSNMIPVRGGSLELSNDSFEVVAPPKFGPCHIEQIVRYFDYYPAEKIYYDEDILNHMDATNLAALYLHESLYKILREESKELNSVRTRRAIGIAFSGEPLPSLRDFVALHPHLECSDPSQRNRFYLVEAFARQPGVQMPIAFLPEVIDGIYVLGQKVSGGTSSYNGVDFYQISDLLKPGAILHGIETNDSDVDLDIKWEFSYRMTRKGPQVTLLNYFNVNGNLSHQPVTLMCH